MSLLSLRKHNLQSQTIKRLRHKTRQTNADKFIEQANEYANGQNDNVIPFQPNDSVKANANRTQTDVVRLSENVKADKQPYRRATFTLSEACIESLKYHANQQQCAKSHLVRMLIRYFDNLPAEQQKQLLEQQKDRE